MYENVNAFMIMYFNYYGKNNNTVNYCFGFSFIQYLLKFQFKILSVSLRNDTLGFPQLMVARFK